MSQENFHARCASGSVKVCCTAQHPVTIAAHQTVVLWGLTHSCPGEVTKVVVEPLDKLQHNSNLEVTPGLVRLSPSGSTCCIPVEVTKNRSTRRTCVAYVLPWSQRFFLPLHGSGSLISCGEKSRKTSETGALTSRFFTYNWNPVYFPVCRFGYKKLIHVHD